MMDAAIMSSAGSADLRSQPVLADRSSGRLELEREREAGLATSLDTGWDSRGEWMTVVEPCLPHIDILFANEDEGRMLTGMAGPADIARAFRARGAATVVLKLGAGGCMVFDGADALDIHAFKVDVIDTTGAGDCFVAGFLAGLHLGYPLAEAAMLANAAGALSTQKLGGVSGVRSLKETLEWIRHAKTKDIQ